MEKITKEQFTELRNRGYTADAIKDIARRGKVYETLNKQTFSQKGLLRSTAEFLGMEEFGRGIGTMLGNVSGTQETVIQGQRQIQKAQSDLIRRIKQKRERGEDISRLQSVLTSMVRDEQRVADMVREVGTQGLSNREVTGSAIQTGLTAASLLGFGPSAKSVGAATGFTGGGVMGAVGRGAAAGALSGGAFGAAEAVTEGTSVGGGALKGAAIGGAVGGVVSGVSQYIDDLTKTTPRSRLFEQKDQFKTLKRNFEKNSVYKTVDGKRVLVSDPISTLSNNKIVPQVVDGKIRTEQAREQIRLLINEQKEEVAEAVSKSMQQSGGAPVSIDTLRKQAIATVKNNSDLQARGVVTKTVNEINKLFDDFAASYGDDLTVQNTNAIRTGMNKVFNQDTIDAERAIGDVMRKHVYQNAPGAQQALAKEGQFIAADKFLDILDGKTVKGGRLGGYFANLLGAIAGSTTDVPIVGPVAGALGASKIQQFMQNQQLNPIAPQMARGITSLVDQLPTDAAGNISKTAVLNLIGQLSGQ